MKGSEGDRIGRTVEVDVQSSGVSMAECVAQVGNGDRILSGVAVDVDAVGGVEIVGQVGEVQRVVVRILHVDFEFRGRIVELHRVAVSRGLAGVVVDARKRHGVASGQVQRRGSASDQRDRVRFDVAVADRGAANPGFAAIGRGVVQLKNDVVAVGVNIEIVAVAARRR